MQILMEFKTLKVKVCINPHGEKVAEAGKEKLCSFMLLLAPESD